MDWDAAYNNMAHVSGSADLPAIWKDCAASYRDGADFMQLNIPYGSHDRETFDIFWPDGTPKGLAVFVHGGYWMRTDKSFWSHLAEGPRQMGWAVAIPSYILTPEARISDITKQIAAAISKVGSIVDGPIRLAGHSAGGQLVTRMICENTPLDFQITDRIERTLSISGLHDLRPLLLTKMNEVLGMDESEAEQESACLNQPIAKSKVIAWVGGGELPEFIRQAELLSDIWQKTDAKVTLNIDENFNHFTVLEKLSVANTPITKAFVG